MDSQQPPPLELLRIQQQPIARLVSSPRRQQLHAPKNDNPISSLLILKTQVAITALLVAGGMVGLSAAYLLRHGASRPHRRIVPGLLVVAVLLAVAAPTVLVVAQPSALCSDFVAVGTPLLTSPSDNTSGATLPCGWDITTPLDPGPGFGHVSGSTPGPQSTFWGSENGTGEPHSWGPDVGWYVAWVAAAVLLAGALLHLRVGRPGNGTTL